MNSWQVQEAKSKFSELIRIANGAGPQFITSHGRQVAVVLSIDNYAQLVKPKKSLAQYLIDSPLSGAELNIERNSDDQVRQIDL